MKQLSIYILLLAFSHLTACSQSHISTYNGKKWEQLEGSGRLLNLNPELAAFNVINVNNANVKIRVETGIEKYAMNISIDDNLKDFFKWKQENNILNIWFDWSGGQYPRWLSGNNTVITIQAPVLEKLINQGNSDIEINLKNQSLFELISEGNPDIRLNGKIKLLQLQSSGNAEINAGALEAEKIILSSNGNADIKVKTKELVEKEINGHSGIVNLFYAAKKENEAGEEPWERTATGLISFQLKNISALPAKVTVISYRPDRAGNGTQSFILIPLGSKKIMFPEGTKIYLANNEQVNIVMSGAAISDQQPFLILKKEDAGKTFKIN